jgi:hypothetical protein
MHRLSTRTSSALPRIPVVTGTGKPFHHRKAFPEISAIVRLTAGCQCAVLYIDKFDPDTTDIQALAESYQAHGSPLAHMGLL